MKGDPLWLTKPKQVSSPVHPFVEGGWLNMADFIGLSYSTHLVVCNLKANFWKILFLLYFLPVIEFWPLKLYVTVVNQWRAGKYDEFVPNFIIFTTNLVNFRLKWTQIGAAKSTVKFSREHYISPGPRVGVNYGRVQNQVGTVCQHDSIAL